MCRISSNIKITEVSENSVRGRKQTYFFITLFASSNRTHDFLQKNRIKLLTTTIFYDILTK